MATVDLLPDAEEELEALPMTEEVALRTVMEKLEALGSRLPFPHQSAVRGASVRELRPRSGRSPWRAFYRRTGAENFLVGSIGPEAIVNPRGFKRAVRLAEQRLTKFKEYGGST
jgi:hypothetical protein